MPGDRCPVTDAQWDTIKDLLPGKETDPGRTALDSRLFVNAVRFVLKTGVPGENRPGRYGSLGPAGQGSGILNSRKCSWIPGPSRLIPSPEADARRCVEGSRGGRTPKLHSAVDRRGRLVRHLITAGHCGDPPQHEDFWTAFNKGTVGRLLADAAYDRGAFRERARRLRAKVCIRPTPTRRVRKRCDQKQSRR